MDPRIGAEISGFRIVSELGRGGMGVVYLAEQAVPRRRVALKLLAPELARDPDFRARFTRETEAAASTEHPNIVPIYAAGQVDGDLFIAMRYVEGTDLASLLRKEGSLPAQRAVAICSQVADALDEAHRRGLVHRDVKPGNVLVDQRDRAYLTDFGLIQRSTASTALTKTGQFMGTIDYVAPEQIKGDVVDGRADIYSLGCVLYECLAGEPPFRRETEVATLYAHLEDPLPKPSVKNPEVPPGLDDVLSKAVAKRPSLRFRTAGDMADSLRVYGLARAARHSRTRRIGIVSAVAAGLVALVLTTFVLTRDGRPTRAPPSVAAPPLNSVVKVDPDIGKVQQIVLDVGQGDASGGHKPRIVIGEGGVWVLQQTTIWEIDPKAPAVDPQTISVNFPPPATFAVGFRAVWVGAPITFGSTGGEIQRFNPSTGAPLASVSLKGPATAVWIGEDAVWAGLQDGDVVRLNGNTGRVEHRLPSGAASIDSLVATTEDVWIADKLAGLLLRVNQTTGDVVPIPITGNIDAIAADDAGVWILDGKAGNVTPVGPSTNTPGQPIRVGEDPSDIAVGLGSVWVTDQTEGQIYRIDPELRKVVDRYSLGSPLAAVAVDLLNHALWVSVSAVG